MTAYGLPVITCSLLSYFRGDWAAAMTLMCPGLSFTTLPPRFLGVEDAPNPFALEHSDQAQAVIVTSYWYEWLHRHHPDRLDDVMRSLEQCAGVLIGLDEVDTFALGFPPHAMDRFAAVIKMQGVYRDRELYNYKVGPDFSGADWTSKVHPRRPSYRDTDLDKLRLSLPCFTIDLPPVRRRLRRLEGAYATGRPMSRAQRAARCVADWGVGAIVRLAPVRRRPLEAHCLVSGTHLQRFAAMRVLEGFSGTIGLTAQPDKIAGTGGTPRSALPSHIQNALAEVTQRYARPGLPRHRFLLDMARHRVVVSPTGYGELCFRHAEALRTGCLLICQDLSHVETMFDFRAGENVVFCRSDLGDLRQRVQQALCDRNWAATVARTGRRDFASWKAAWRAHLFNGIEAHVRNAVGSATLTRAPR